MSNMSYCRFQNTLRDLQDCLDYLDDELDDEDEENARKEMLVIFNNYRNG